MKIRYTDTEKHPRPYATAEQSKEPGYLAAKFAQIRERQEKDAAEAQANVRDMKRKIA